MTTRRGTSSSAPAPSAWPPSRPSAAAARPSGWSTAPGTPASPTTSRSSAATPATRPSPPRSPAGARVVYQTLNPPYAEWTEQFPALQAGVLAAAEATGARLVSMENVYMYGRPAGRPLTEDRAYDAHTKKGQLRGRMARELLAAHRGRPGRGRDRPRLGLLRPPRRRPVQPGRPGVPRRPGRQDRHRARRPRPAAHLHLHPRHRRGPRRPRRAPRRARARSGTCPTTPTPAPPVQLVDIVYRQAGQPATEAARHAPAAAARASGLVNPTVRELLEMQYQFEEPFIVDSSKIATSSASGPPPSSRPSPTPCGPTARGDLCQWALRGPGKLARGRTPAPVVGRDSSGMAAPSAAPPTPPAPTPAGASRGRARALLGTLLDAVPHHPVDDGARSPPGGTGLPRHPSTPVTTGCSAASCR